MGKEVVVGGRDCRRKSVSPTFPRVSPRHHLKHQSKSPRNQNQNGETRDPLNSSVILYDIIIKTLSRRLVGEWGEVDGEDAKVRAMEGIRNLVPSHYTQLIQSCLEHPLNTLIAEMEAARDGLV